MSVVYTNMFKENVRSNRLTAVAFKEKHIKIIIFVSEFQSVFHFHFRIYLISIVYCLAQNLVTQSVLSKSARKYATLLMSSSIVDRSCAKQNRKEAE